MFWFWLRFRFSIAVLAVVACALACGTARACEACRRYGLDLHGHSAGGDAFEDAIYPDEEGGSASFVLQGGKWIQPGGLGSPITLTYSYQNMFDGGIKMPNEQPLPNDIIKRSIEEAFRLWASVVPIHFVEVEDDGLEYGQGATKYGQIRFRHDRINGRDPEIGAPSTKAQAYFPSNGDPIRGDVEFDHDDRWQVVGELRRPDILGAAIHELGHSLGLGHSLETKPGEFWEYQQYNGNQIVTVQEPMGNANMYWIFTRYSGPGTGMLFADDIAGIRARYGAGVGSVTPLVPEPASIALALVALLCAATTRRRAH